MVRLDDIHTLVCDGYDGGQEGEDGHWGNEWMCGLWNETLGFTVL